MKVIASHNGLAAAAKARELLLSGVPPLDACVEGVTLVEDDPNEHSVGYGGIPNEDGVVELDAGVMDGRTHRGAGVAALQNVRHPSRVARLVMEQTSRVLLVGEGALQFARANGFVEENLLTDKARRIWLHWKRIRSQLDDWRAPPPQSVDPDVQAWFDKFFSSPAYTPTRSVSEGSTTPTRSASEGATTPTRSASEGSITPTRSVSEGSTTPTRSVSEGSQAHGKAGTVHVAAQGDRGDLACVTSTSGHAFKLPGRVGDSPILGAGLYADNDAGTCGSLGHGEVNLENLSSFAAVELMRTGKSPEEAGLEILRRIATRAHPDQLDAQGRPRFNLWLYLLSKDGRHAGVTMWGPKEFAIADERAARLVPCVALFNAPRK